VDKSTKPLQGKLGDARLRSFSMLEIKHTSIEIWGSIPLCLIWTIWREMNIHTFEGKELLPVQLKFLLLTSLYECPSISTSFFIWNLVDF
jgi:hypothetical protein